MMASGKTPGLTREANGVIIGRENNTDVFVDMKQWFLSFKKHKYMDNLEHFKILADAQAPKTLGFVLLLSWDFNQCKLSKNRKGLDRCRKCGKDARVKSKYGGSR